MPLWNSRGTLCYKADLHYREHHFVCYTEYQKSWVTSHIMIVPGGDNCAGHINHIVSIQQIFLLLNHLHWSLFLLINLKCKRLYVIKSRTWTPWFKISIWFFFLGYFLFILLFCRSVDMTYIFHLLIYMIFFSITGSIWCKM